MNSIDLIRSVRCITKAYDGVLKKICARFGLNMLEVKVISFLHNNPQMNTAGDIAEYRMLSKGNVSQAVENLTRGGYMESSRDASDRRRVYLRLSAKAENITDMIDVEWKKFDRKLFGNFSDEELALYDSFKERLMGNAIAVIKENGGSDE